MVKTSALEAVIPNREIYTGRGGQNAQILLPFGWFYGEPGYVEKSVYKCYVRNESHSHSQNTSEKIIQQLYNYENILINTMKIYLMKRFCDILVKYMDIIQNYDLEML